MSHCAGYAGATRSPALHAHLSLGDRLSLHLLDPASHLGPGHVEYWVWAARNPVVILSIPEQ